MKQRTGRPTGRHGAAAPSGKRISIPWPVYLVLTLAVVVGVCVGAVARHWRQNPVKSLMQEPKQAAWADNLVPNDADIRLTWEYQPTELDAVPPGINVLAPTWLYVEANEAGNPVLVDLSGLDRPGFDPTGYLETAHAGGAQVWATVVSFDSDLSKAVVTNPEYRKQFLDALRAWVERYPVDGINLDFEKMDPADKAAFTDLAADCKQALGDRTLSCSVTVPTPTEQADNWYQCYDRGGLAEVCDYITLMTYDAHRDGDLTPVAGINWVHSRLQQTLLEVPSNKLVLGVPFYGVEYTYTVQEQDDLEAVAWSEGDNRKTITRAQVEALLDNGQLTRGDTVTSVIRWLDRGTWQPALGVTSYGFEDGQGLLHQIYLDDGLSLTQKGALVSQYSLAGVAVWQKKQGSDAMFEALAQGVAQKEDP